MTYLGIFVVNKPTHNKQNHGKDLLIIPQYIHMRICAWKILDLNLVEVEVILQQNIFSFSYLSLHLYLVTMNIV